MSFVLPDEYCEEQGGGGGGGGDGWDSGLTMHADVAGGRVDMDMDMVDVDMDMDMEGMGMDLLGRLDPRQQADPSLLALEQQQVSEHAPEWSEGTGAHCGGSVSSSFSPETYHSSSGCSSWNPSPGEGMSHSSPEQHQQQHQQQYVPSMVGVVKQEPQPGGGSNSKEGVHVKSEGGGRARKRRKTARVTMEESDAIKEAEAFIKRPKPSNMSKQQEKEWRSTFRKMKNRISAQQSRNKRAREEEELLEEKENLERENCALREQYDGAMAHIEQLTRRNLHLEKENGQLGRQLQEYRKWYGPLGPADEPVLLQEEGGHEEMSSSSMFRHHPGPSSVLALASPATIAFFLLLVVCLAVALPSAQQGAAPVPLIHGEGEDVDVATAHSSSSSMEVDFDQEDATVPLAQQQQQQPGRRGFTLLSVDKPAEGATGVTSDAKGAGVPTTFSTDLVLRRSSPVPAAANPSLDLEKPGGVSPAAAASTSTSTSTAAEQLVKHSFGGRRVPFRNDMRVRGAKGSDLSPAGKSRRTLCRRSLKGSPGAVMGGARRGPSRSRSPSPSSAGSKMLVPYQEHQHRMNEEQQRASLMELDLTGVETAAGGRSPWPQAEDAALIRKPERGGEGQEEEEEEEMAAALGGCVEGEEEEEEEEEQLGGEGGGNVLPAVISGPSQLFLWCPMVYPMLESGKEGMPVDLSKPTTISLLVPAQALQRTLRALSPDQKSYHLDPEMLLGPSKAQFLEIRFMVSCTPGEDRCRMTDGSLGATTAQAAAAAADTFGGPSASASAASSALSPLS